VPLPAAVHGPVRPDGRDPVRECAEGSAGAGARTAHARGFRILLAPLADLFTLLDGDAEIVPGIRAASCPGHSPGHMVVEVGGAISFAILTLLAAILVGRLMPRLMARMMADEGCSERMRECMEKCGCGESEPGS
jgi:glyoxylase-like metal-dependent hydrolase (beta-lactamase superfamily II)